jgi:hypothetical protein
VSPARAVLAVEALVASGSGDPCHLGEPARRRRPSPRSPASRYSRMAPDPLMSRSVDGPCPCHSALPKGRRGKGDPGRSTATVWMKRGWSARRLDPSAWDVDPNGIGNGKTWNHTGAPRGGALVTASSCALPCSCCDNDTGAADATPSCIGGDRRGRRDETRSGLLSCSVLHRRIFASTELVKNRAAILIR